MQNSLFDLKGKTFFVTGASSGIGYEVCKTISLLNGHFIAVARRKELLEALVSECNSTNNSFIVADLSLTEEVKRVANSIEKIDGVVHAAGFAKLAGLKFYKENLLNEMRSIHYDSIVMLMSFLTRGKKLNSNSSIVLIASIAANFGMKGNGIYAGIKGALVSISRVWANELANQKIRVNCVSPGMVRTEIAKETESLVSKEAIEEDEKKYPLGYGLPEDVANPVVFLLSDASKWITGQNLILDGGRSSVI